MRGLREPLVSRGFRCGQDRTQTGNFAVTVPPDFPCYYDVVGRGYVNRGYANSLNTLLNYLRGTLTLVQNGGAYRTEAEYNSQAPAPVRGGGPARTLPKKPPYRRKCIEGATQKVNGKWSSPQLFPGREFDDLDAYRVAKKQRTQ